MKKPFVIAEMSGNHNQDIEKAKQLISKAKEVGADAVKLQTYTADTITLNCDKEGFVIYDKDSLWSGRKLYDLYNEAHTPWAWHKELFDHAKKEEVLIFSSPFDTTAVDLLESLECPIYKIASFEITDIALIEYIAMKKKPVILSTGVGTISEISEAVFILNKYEVPNITLLHCVSSYPAPVENTNLETLRFLKDTFQVTVGLSDHSLGIGVAVGAAALGAEVIEKHFVLDRSEGGVDSAFSLEPDEFKSLVKESKIAFAAAKGVTIRHNVKENLPQRMYSRSIYISTDVKKGDLVTLGNIKSIRPGLGLHPKYLKLALGKKFNGNFDKGTPLCLGHMMTL